MSSVGLMFVGAVLFVNALLLLGKVDARSAGTFNLFVGALQTAVPWYLIAHAKTTDDILLASGIFLFGFTYLYVGITNLAGQEPLGLGWYCAWVAIMACAFGLTNIIKFDDVKIGVLWLQWSVLWALFWLVLGLGMASLTRFTGWVTLILSFSTCTIPGFLLLLGEWDPIPNWVSLVVLALTAVVLLAIASPSIRGERERLARGPEAVPPDVSINVGV
jgi:putative amide transporter protein